MIFLEVIQMRSMNLGMIVMICQRQVELQKTV